MKHSEIREKTERHLPDSGALRLHPGYTIGAARMERSGIREHTRRKHSGVREKKRGAQASAAWALPLSSPPAALASRRLRVLPARDGGWQMPQT